MVSDDRPIRRKRRKLGVYYALILVLVVVVGFFVLHKRRLRVKLDRRIEAIRAGGYPVTCAELDDWYSIPEDAENASELILEAIADYREPENPELVPIVGEANSPGRTEELSAEAMKAIGEYLADNEYTLALLGQAAGLEYSRYPVDLRAGFNVVLDHPKGIRTVARLGMVEAMWQAQKKEGDAAVEAVEHIYGAVRSLSGEPLLISHLVRIACDALGVSAIECVVNRVDLGEEQLVDLSEMVAGVEERSDMVRAFVGERCALLDMFMNPEEIDPRTFGGARLSGVLISIYKGAGLTTKGAIVYLDYAEEFMAVNQLDEHLRVEAAKAIEGKLEKASGISVMMVRMIMPAYTRIIEIHLRHIASLRAAGVALAIERHRLAEAELPSTLEKLIPKYLDAVPRDPFDGAELRYLRLAKGYAVYSVGGDGNDDGGREKSKDNRENWDITFIVER